MKKAILFLGLFIFLNGTKLLRAQSSTATLDVVSWNLEFFGAPFNNGPADKDLQEANAKKIMRYLDADIYGLIEIVDSMRMRRLVDSLGNTEFGFVIAPYCSNNTTGTGASWLNGQKLAFIYRKSIFSNMTIRGLLRTSAPAYNNWASGRFPYMLSATVTINGSSRNMNFILVHGKAGTTTTDYDRRLAGAQELKDTLDTHFSTAINLIIGDYNDALNQTISPGSGPQTSYQPIVADSTDADHYKSITLPLAYLGQTTMINFPNVVDNHVISNETVPYYIPASVQIRTDITSVVPDYVSAHNTSDHWPVFSKYNLAGVITSLPDVTAAELGINVFPNPSFNEMNLRTSKRIEKASWRVLNLFGQEIQSGYYPVLNPGTTVQPELPPMAKGIYFLEVQTPGSRTIIKITRL
ncbi:MAG TPA: T9SS type A sorting domain-containing protein [Chitinophagaceae bacterium]|nr:T9SS type A sorting domain-containing protein [Chitinophagaceae bacterium]